MPKQCLNTRLNRLFVDIFENSTISKDENKANAHAGMPYFGVSRFVVSAARLVIGNSPFGAWVVCVYRLKAVESPTQVNASTYAFFVFLHNRRNLCRAGANTGLFVWRKAFAYAKHTVPKPAQHGV